MPKRISGGARQQKKSLPSGAEGASESSVRSREVESFGLDDIVVERRPPHRVGRVCEVSVPGTIYRVIFQGAVQCAACAHDDLAMAPAGSNAPICPADC